MKDIPGLTFHLRNGVSVGIPVENVMELFDRAKDRASPIVKLRQYLSNPVRLDDLSELELVAIVSIVEVVRQSSGTILSPTDIVAITELTREWVKICYKSWGKLQPKRHFPLSPSQEIRSDISTKSESITDPD